MNVKNIIKNEINQVLKKHFDLKNIDFSIEYPPSSKMGDYACNVGMVLAKKMEKNPMELAEEIKIALNSLNTLKNIFEKIEVVKPGFLNFFLSEDILKNNIKEILKSKKNFGKSKIGKGKKIIIDYSSPNVAKNMHVGHLRSTIIGDSLARIFDFLGYKVISDNHVGDWGTQYGILLYEYKNKYGKKIKDGLTIDELEKMYVNYMKKEKENPEIRIEAKKELKRLQDKENVNFKLWQYFYKISRKEFEKIYKKLKIRKFDLWNGESFYNDQLENIVKMAIEKNVAKKSKGAIIIPLDKFNLPPMLIQKADGAYLYGTTDLATIVYRQKKYNPEKNLYVVANQQTLHFEQLFSSSKLLGFCDKERMEHIKFGLVLDKNGKKMSTREGGAVKLTQLINESIQKAKKIVEKKNPNLSDKEKNNVAEKIGVGALKYNDLSQNKLSDIVFDWDKMLNFESGSVPYLQYTYVRIKSILNKATIKIENKKFNKLTHIDEILLLKNLFKFPEIINNAGKNYKPNLIANYLNELSGNFHRYYEDVSILNSKKETCRQRLGLISAVAQVIKNGLDLLGIEVMDKM